MLAGAVKTDRRDRAVASMVEVVWVHGSSPSPLLFGQWPVPCVTLPDGLLFPRKFSTLASVDLKVPLASLVPVPMCLPCQYHPQLLPLVTGRTSLLQLLKFGSGISKVESCHHECHLLRLHSIFEVELCRPRSRRATRQLQIDLDCGEIYVKGGRDCRATPASAVQSLPSSSHWVVSKTPMHSSRVDSNRSKNSMMKTDAHCSASSVTAS
ncbi:hypothetical protein B0H66DRAFT_356282 [Apodospora peruviana]|uniref:Uncharacterized protein n=1 Tax=Apodospora peruviana TaxID=516989 RepID=A0AAE0M0E8_9PEZI|nr:hypothetical protein B0H66DRAFT_356282 [Apodospora peruviana]